MSYALIHGVIAFVVTLLAGGPFIGLLHHLGIGKELNVVGPESHKIKAGTPTMGGVVIITVIAIVTASTNLVGKESMGLLLAVTIALAVLGLLDDLGSLQGKVRHALNKRLKFIAFLVVGLAAAFGLYVGLDLRTILIPYAGEFEIGATYIPIAVAIIVLTAGGVAVSDGLDGLAAGTISIAFIAYGVIAITQSQDSLAAFCFTVSGATLAFLWHNSHPAQIFMGDVGALALGGALATAAFMTGHWLLLPIIGIVFVLEGASDVIQVAYFRLTGGKRILKMAPLHHHFELLGCSEVQVVQRFWLLGALGAVVGIILALEVN